jgi:hypothetical protein
MPASRVVRAKASAARVSQNARIGTKRSGSLYIFPMKNLRSVEKNLGVSARSLEHLEYMKLALRESHDVALSSASDQRLSSVTQKTVTKTRFVKSLPCSS